MVVLKNLAVLIGGVLPAILAAPAPAAENKASKYIVTLKRGLSDDDVSSHMQYARDLHRRTLEARGSPSGVTHTEGVRHEFHIGDFQSYSAHLDARTAADVSRHGSVHAIEEVVPIQITETRVQQLAPWGLGSLSTDFAGDVNTGYYPVNSYYYDSEAQGQDMWAYVIDTGIRVTHSEFDGRAIVGFSAFANETADQDFDGHGTHVAGTIGGRKFGVAKKTNIVAVKVFDKNVRGDSEGILRAMQWVHDDAVANNRSDKSVINMSLTISQTGYSPSVDAMVDALTEANILVVVAAGNDDRDAALNSPANAPNALTVGAIYVNNTRVSVPNWWGSNYGPTVDIFAPGVNILSAGIKDDHAMKYSWGTSMACPHVAGLAVSMRSQFGIKSAINLKTSILNFARKDVVLDARGSWNRLAWNGMSVAEPLN